MKYPEPSNLASFYEPKSDPKDDYVFAVCEEIKVSNETYDKYQKFILAEAGQAYENEDSISETAEKITLAVQEMEQEASGF